MICPKCNSCNIRVSDTMPGEDGHIYRRRKCVNCGHKFHSIEQIFTDNEVFSKGYTAAYLLKTHGRFKK